MKLTIIIPCYNEVRYIEKIIASINQQPFDDKQIIVVDDSSSDGTKEKLISLKKIGYWKKQHLDPKKPTERKVRI